MEQPTLDSVVADLLPYDPEKVIVFGSWARGDTDEFSDLDLVIIKRTEERFVRRAVEAGGYINWPTSVDVFVYTPEEFQTMREQDNPFIERVLAEGRVIYEKRP